MSTKECFADKLIALFVVVMFFCTKGVFGIKDIF